MGLDGEYHGKIATTPGVSRARSPAAGPGQRHAAAGGRPATGDG